MASEGSETEGVAPIDEDFLCPVCMALLLEPITLNCGHTVCRGCLAGWFLSARLRRRECPTCRQMWEGYLQVNTTLRNIIKRQHGDRVAERLREMEESADYNYHKNLRRFEKELRKRRLTVQPGHAPNYIFFVAGVVFAGFIVLVIFMFCLIYATGMSSNYLKSKTEIPVALWKPGEVASWLNSLGWARNYSDFVEYYVLDGRALLNVETVKLMELLNITDPNHQHAFELTMESLRESGVRMPQTVWEYKALYPWRTLFLTHGMNKAPRSVMLYLFLFHHEELFIPFLHITVPRKWGGKFQFSRKLSSPSVSQFLVFLMMMLVFPYGMVGLFAWSLRSTHTLTHLMLITLCFLRTMLELNFLCSCLLQGQWREWEMYLKTHLQTLAWMSVFYVGWPLGPSWVDSFLVCTILYATPFAVFGDFWNTVNEHED